MTLQRIISGGQTGVDRAALTAAIEAGIAHGGWCPRGRRAEDGRIPAHFQLQELAASDYSARTIRNVAEADGTLILHCGRLTGGTALTAGSARQQHKPLLLIDLDEPHPDPKQVRDWIKAARIRVLNVAGPRESTSPGIHDRALAFLRDVFEGRITTET